MDTYEKKYRDANNKVAARFGINVAKEIFTDLYESEDKMIRKELITHCRNTRCVTEEGAERIAKWIAWLEKQGEKKLQIEMISAEESLGIDSETYNKIVNDCIFGYDKQKPAWSEEDERMFDYALDMIEWYSGKNEDKSRLVSDWLKSLRPQPKQKWNKGDEEMFKSLKTLLNNASCYSCTEGVDKILSWVKSLKNRVISQTKQEWSEEDQNALEDVREAVVHYWGGDSQDILLYWLKSIKQKIKGE